MDLPSAQPIHNYNEGYLIEEVRKAHSKERKTIEIDGKYGKQKIVVFVDPPKERNINFYPPIEPRQRIVKLPPKIIRQSVQGSYKLNNNYPAKEENTIQDLTAPNQDLDQNYPQNPETDNLEPSNFIEGEYIVKVGNSLVDFGKHGIKQVKFNRNDEIWIERARQYFAKNYNGNKYNTTEILQALWSTAETIGTNPKRFIIQMFQETSLNPNLTGQAGEKGLGQFMYATAISEGYDWNMMSAGELGYAYQAKAAAQFVKKVGEVRYNGSGPMAQAYKAKIDAKMAMI
jgi:hypothetical protein